MLREIEAIDNDMMLIGAWGGEVQPQLEDHLPVPEDGEQVELR